MTRFSKILLTIIAIAISSWLLPWAYHFTTSKGYDSPFTMYSPITHSFSSIINTEGKIKYVDIDGTQYTEAEYDSIMPTFYYRQLMADGRLPSQINGRAVSAPMIKKENFIFRTSPSEVNNTSAALYSLLESSSGRVDLEMPNDVFRIVNTIEFISMKTNEVDSEKSAKYHQALLSAGFTFPPKGVFGNPTTRKEYDEGYFIIDAKGAIFHLKQIKGEPFVKNTNISPTLGVEHIFVTEYSAKHFYAFLSTKKGEFYILQTPDYTLSQIAIDPFDVKKDGMMTIGNMFFWTLKTSTAEGEKYYAVNAEDYTIENTYENPYTADTYSKISGYLFPFELTFTSYQDKWVYPRIDSISFSALYLNIALALMFIFVKRHRLKKRKTIANTALIVIVGVFMLIPALLLSKK